MLEVTNLLDDNQPGCLRYALMLNAAKAPVRTIVFRVSGTIHLVSPRNISYLNSLAPTEAKDAPATPMRRK